MPDEWTPVANEPLRITVRPRGSMSPAPPSPWVVKSTEPLPPGMVRQPGAEQWNLDTAQQEMTLSPQERALYERHVKNLTGAGGVDNPDGSRSSLYQMSFERGGKTFNIPTVWDGKILKPEEAIKRAEREGLDKFPSYGSQAEAEARYQQMHGYMERDTKQFLENRRAEQWKVKSTAPLPLGTVRQPGAEDVEPAPRIGLLGAAAEPFTSLPGEFQRIVRESAERMKQGVQSFKEGKKLKGAFELGTGALDYMFSPISAPVHTIAGRPLERATGLPHEWTEFAAMLGIPGIGLASTARGKDVLKPLEKILSPQTVSPIAGEAEASIRSFGGQAARDTATTAAEMEPYHKAVNALPDVDRLDFLHYVEGNPSLTGAVPPQLRPFADKLKDAFELRKTKLQALPSTQQAQFIEDYFPHFWQDPAAARAFANKFGTGASKQGSGASLRKRTMPTIADGIVAGLKPLTTDPIEATMRYVTSMDRFIASTSVLDAAKANGTVKYIRPKTMGASGHPESFRVPDGWVAIKGRGARDATGAQAYAPADWARLYNNFIDQGFLGSETWGRPYEAMRNAGNAITAMELGFSGYHAFTMANEAVISEVARGISQIVGGKPIRALGTIASAPAAPIRTALRGHKAEQVYLGRTPGTPDMRKIVDLQTAAGGRAVGRSHAADYTFSAMGSFWTSFRRGALKQELRQSMQNIADRPIVGTAKEGGKMIGRIMQTVAQPVFEKYIPKLKNGAFYDTMHSWLEVHPAASYDEQVAAARQIWDSIDNRFGEMVQDNIFWDQHLKQVSQLAMRSYSWNMGTIREIGGGVRDVSKVITGQGEWTPKASYVIALPIVVATMNAAYQYLKTGKGPESVEDLVAGRTGGTAPGFGGRGTVEERIALPGYQKDVFGWYNDWLQEARNKIATGPSMVAQGLAGKDWRGDLIAQPDADVPQWLADYFTWVGNSMGPISVRQLMKGEKEDSAISTPEMLMGLRPAPAFLQDPEGTKRGMSAIERRRWKSKARHDRRQQQQYGGPQE
jgi:hypothetical protein